jgi:hypothetical protein
MVGARYEYQSMPAETVYGLTSEPLPGSYVADDSESRRYRWLLEAGYRWVRTEQGIAIFERARHGSDRDATHVE